jgi:heme-degrading monooxygenase HmoA
MIARMATYTFTGDAKELGERAESGILPVLQGQAGFEAYSVAATDSEILSLSVWDTRENADAGNAAVADWVAANMAGELTNPEIRFADVLFSTTLGVSTLA